MSIIPLTLIAAVISFILGAIWYMPLFGRAWGRAIEKMPGSEPKLACKKQIGPLVLTFIMDILIAFVLFNVLAVFGVTTIPQAYLISGVMFLGFVLPMQVSAVLWNGRSTKSKWTIFLISGGFQLLNFLALSIVFVLLA